MSAFFPHTNVLLVPQSHRRNSSIRAWSHVTHLLIPSTQLLEFPTYLWESHPSAFTPPNPQTSIIPGKCTVTIAIESEKQKNDTTDREEAEEQDEEKTLLGEMQKKTGREAGNNCENSLKVKTLKHISKKKSEQREKRISHESVSVELVTHRRCRVCLLRRMGLRGSLFLKLDCNLDKRSSGPREGARQHCQAAGGNLQGQRASPIPPHHTHTHTSEART